MGRQTAVERFLSRVQKTEGGCWLWTGPKNQGGYGMFSIGDTSSTAHRFAYILFVDPSIEARRGWWTHVDHLCRVPACVNPAHLEAVTPSENAQRGIAARLAARAQ